MQNLIDGMPVDCTFAEGREDARLHASKVIPLARVDLLTHARIALLDVHVPSAVSPLGQPGYRIAAPISDVRHVKAETNLVGALQQGIDLEICF